MTKSPETIWAAEMAVRLSEMQAERDAAIARAEKAEAAMQWQSIDAAPKDGTEFLGFVGVSYQGGVVVLHWDNEDGFIDWDADFWEPTHWMPLPMSPETP